MKKIIIAMVITLGLGSNLIAGIIKTIVTLSIINKNVRVL